MRHARGLIITLIGVTFWSVAATMAWPSTSPELSDRSSVRQVVRQLVANRVDSRSLMVGQRKGTKPAGVTKPEVRRS